MEAVYHTLCQLLIFTLNIGVLFMNSVQYYIGIDISNNDFAASIFTAPSAPVKTMTEIANEFSGFEQFESWLISNQVQTNRDI